VAHKNLADETESLREKKRELRDSQKSWGETFAALTAEVAQHKASFVAQSQLLAEAQCMVFELESKAKETAPKIAQLHDYEHRIEQHKRMQVLWEKDVQRIVDLKARMEVMGSQYKKMDERLLSYKGNNDILTKRYKAAEADREMLERRMEAEALQRTRTAAKPSAAQQFESLVKEIASVKEANLKLREDYAQVKDHNEELEVMVEMLRAQAGLGLGDPTSEV